MKYKLNCKGFIFVLKKIQYMEELFTGIILILDPYTYEDIFFFFFVSCFEQR